MRHARSIAVAAAGFATFVNLYTPQAILPLLAAEFHVGLPQTSVSITVSLLAVALVAPFAGGISDRVGRKRLIVAAAYAVIVPTLLIATSPNLPALLLWRFLQGLLLPFIFAVTVAYIGDECDGQEAIRVTGLYTSGTIVGGFSGRFLAGVIADLAGWRVAFAALAALTGLGALVVAVLLPSEVRFRPMTGGPRATFGAMLGHLENRRLLATCVVGFGLLFGLVALFTFVNFRLAAPPYDLRPAQLGAVFTVYLCGAVATPVATRLAARLGRVPTLLAALAIGICGIGLTLLAPLAAIVAGLALACMGLFVAQTLSLSFIGVAARQAKSAAVGLYVTVYYLGGAIGGVAPIWLWHRFGWPGVAALVALVMAGMGGVAARFWRTEQQYSR